MIGVAVIGFILVPLFVLLVISVVGSPTIAKVATMFTGAVLLQIMAFIISFAIFAAILGFIVP